MPQPRRKRAPTSGNDRENKIKEFLESDGWLVASRRHIGGAGDLLAVRLHGDGSGHEVWLIEVKSTARSPWHAFPPADRQALISAAYAAGVQAWLAWWPPRRACQWINASEFPNLPTTTT
jgi:hypothetical protein